MEPTVRMPLQNPIEKSMSSPFYGIQHSDIINRKGENGIAQENTDIKISCNFAFISIGDRSGKKVPNVSHNNSKT